MFHRKNRSSAKFQMSLFEQIFICLFINAIAILCLVYFFTNQYVESYNNTIQGEIETELDKAGSGVQSVFDDFREIGHILTTSGQFTYAGKYGEVLTRWPSYINSAEHWDSQVVMTFYSAYLDLQHNLELMATLNASVGNYLVFAVSDTRGNELILSNQKNISQSQLDEIATIPTLTGRGGFVFHMPHPSLYSNNEVLSVTYRLNTQYEIYLYMETNDGWFQSISDLTAKEWPIYFTMADAQGNILYSQAPNANLAGMNISDVNEHAVHKFGTENSSKGQWSYYGLMSNDAYKKAFNGWGDVFVIICGCSFALLFIVNLLLYWSIYKNFKALGKLIHKTANMAEIIEPKKIGIREFDGILNTFYTARTRNIQLLQQIRENEKMGHQLEYEKLMLQINPHFIQNSLNSIQWMARINQQGDIQRMATSLIKVFNYNLQSNMMSCLRDEMVAIRAYMDVQMMRYKNCLTVEYHIREEDDNLPIPRFLLQPLLENAILYGADSAGKNNIIIRVCHSLTDSYILSVRDSGNGFTQDLKTQLLSGKIQNGSGVGIGLRYVVNALNYCNGCVLDAQSDCEGAALILRLPISQKEI